MVIIKYINKGNEKLKERIVREKGETSMINPTIQELQERLKANISKAVVFAEKNTMRNSAGQVILGADDEWRVANDWNNDYDRERN